MSVYVVHALNKSRPKQSAELCAYETMSGSYFSDLPVLSPDEGFPLLAAFKEDSYPQKISLGAGVYRDEKGLPWVLPVVRKASHYCPAASSLRRIEILTLLTSGREYTQG